jgi:hypothetical protein
LQPRQHLRQSSGLLFRPDAGLRRRLPTPLASIEARGRAIIEPWRSRHRACAPAWLRPAPSGLGQQSRTAPRAASQGGHRSGKHAIRPSGSFHWRSVIAPPVAGDGCLSDARSRGTARQRDCGEKEEKGAQALQDRSGERPLHPWRLRHSMRQPRGVFGPTWQSAEMRTEQSRLRLREVAERKHGMRRAAGRRRSLRSNALPEQQGLRLPQRLRQDSGLLP